MKPISAVLLMALGACASASNWVMPPGMSEQDARRAQYACERDAYVVPAAAQSAPDYRNNGMERLGQAMQDAGASMQATAARAQLYADCMSAAGFRQE